MTDFDMPDHSATFEARGGWMVRALAGQFGLTLEQAAGIVGNLGFESGALKKLHEIGQPEGVGGYGWGQWTASRRVTFLAFAKSRGLDWQSDEANYGYLVEELSGAYKSTIAAVKRAVTLDAAVWSVGQTYERPGGTTATNLPGYADRLASGKRALNGAKAAAPPGAVAGPVLPAADAIGTAEVVYASVRAPTPMPPVSGVGGAAASADVPATAPVSSARVAVATNNDITATIRTLQTQLAAIGLYNDAIDGDPGTHTIAAIDAWRAAQ